MHQQWIRLISSLSLATFIIFSSTNNALAQSGDNTNPSTVAMQKISAQTQALERQMRALQMQLRELKQQQAQLLGEKSVTKPKQRNAKRAKRTTVGGARPTNQKAISHHSPHHGKDTDKVLEGNPAGTLGTQPDTSSQVTRWLDIRGTTVVTSPYFGPQPQFDGSDMLVTTSSVNKDLVLLQMKQKIAEELKGAQKPQQTYSVIALSGEVEGAASISNGFDNKTTSDLDLKAAELDVAALVHPWLMGYVTFEYDNSALPSAIEGYGRRSKGSNVQVGQGFLTIGNLNRTPVYFTLGQLYAPFGQYSSFMYSDSLPKILGRAKIRGAVLGYNGMGMQQQTGPYATVYTFSGDSRITRKRNIDEGGFNLGYRYRQGLFKANASVSIISNMADSNGMQSNGVGDSDQFRGFGANSTTEQLQHRVPGIDTQANLNYGAFTLIGDYLTAMRSFDVSDVSYNGSGATPSAMHVEGAYNFIFHNRPGSFALGYDHSWQALAFNIPRDRVITALNYSVWRNTIASLEYRYDINYNSADRASGTGGSVALAPGGRTSNNVILVLDYFF